MTQRLAGVLQAAGSAWRASACLVAAVLVIAAVVFTSAGAASAHNVDELLQQIYVTPMLQGVNVSVEMTPGSQVATGLLSLIDSDGNQVISTSEAAAHTETVRSALTFTTDGRPVAARLVHTTYPDVPLLVAGGGTIILDFSVDIPATTQARSVRISNNYAPGAAAGPLLTKVQANLTPDALVPVTIETMTHEDDGRTLAVRYSPSVASSPATVAATNTPRKGSTSISPILFVGSALAIGLAALLLRSRRPHALST